MEPSTDLIGTFKRFFYEKRIQFYFKNLKNKPFLLLQFEDTVSIILLFKK